MKVIQRGSIQPHELIAIVCHALRNNTRALRTSFFKWPGYAVRVEFMAEGGDDCWIAVVDAGPRNEQRLGSVFLDGSDLT